MLSRHIQSRKGRSLTELDAGVLLAHILALLIGEKHVGGQTTLGGVGVYRFKLASCVSGTLSSERRHNIPFLPLRPFSTFPPFLAAALGMLSDLVPSMLVKRFGQLVCFTCIE